MKYIFPKFILLILILNACSEVDELTEFDTDQTLTETITVDVPDNQGGPDTFSATETIDLSAIEEISEDLIVIQDVTINAIQYEVMNFVGAANATVTNASITFDNITISISDINLEQADNNDTIFVINDPAQLAAISNVLQVNNVVTATLSASIDSTPALFDVKIDLLVTATVDFL